VGIAGRIVDRCLFEGLSYMRALTLTPALLALAGIASACSGDDTSDAQPVINSFEISATDVTAGQKATLTWSTTDADSIEIYSSADASTPFFTGSEGAGSTQTPEIYEPTTYTLFAKNTASGNETSQTVEVLSVGGIQIASFTANPMMAAEDAEVTLSWVIGGEDPSEVVVKDRTGAEVFRDDSPGKEGSFSLVPVPDENNEATYRLQIRGPSGRDEASVTVTVDVIIDQPEIVDFFASSADVAKGSRAQLTWEVANTVDVQLSLNGVVARPWTEVGVPNGNTRITVNESMNTFKLEARSEDGVIVSEEVMVRGLDVPVIDVLEVSPTSYTLGSTIATVTWETSETDSVNLQLNGRDVNGFPRQMLAGTFQLEVAGAAELTFIATNPVQDTTRTVNIELGYDDTEPNETPAQAIAIPADGLSVRGTITTPEDVDWYVFMVPQGSFLYAQVGYTEVSGCNFDTLLRMYDSDGTTELGFVDNTNAPNISPCSEMNPIVHDYAANLPAGTYYISVGAGGGANNTGQYDLTVRIVTPIGDIPGRMPALKIGDPQWRVSDFVQFTGPLDGAAAIPFSVGLNPIFNPMHSPATGSGLGVLMTTDTPHQTDYSIELSMAMGMRGKTNGATFLAAEIIDPGAMYVGFTVSPTATATTGSSGDFMSGPILPQSLYPLAGELDFEGDGMAIPDLHTEYDIVYGGGAAADGSSHEHVFAAVRANAGTAPADLVADYSWEYTVLDANMEGYTFSVPFVLTE